MIYKLENIIQKYHWGSKDFIPKLLNVEADGNPKAELWMGAHPKAPSNLFYNGKKTTLLNIIEYIPDKTLGPEISNRYNSQLPFLFKILSSARPLSIQSHPDLNQAKIGFRKENELEIPITAYNRNYKDSNHKPELMCALTSFEAMCGFQPIENIADRMNHLNLTDLVPITEKFISIQTERAFKQMFFFIMSMSKNEKKDMVAKVVNTVRKTKPRSKDEALIFNWIEKLSQIYPGDIGVISPLYLNVVKLQPGQALYLEPGTLHAYLQGSGIELMANSDNVLRGGLTSKNVDVVELMKVLKFEHKKTKIILPHKISESESVYETSASEFQLSAINLKNEFCVENVKGPEIILCTEGEAIINDTQLKKGESVFISFSEKKYKIKGSGIFYRAVVPERDEK